MLYIILGDNSNEFRKNADITHNARALRIAGEIVCVHTYIYIYISNIYYILLNTYFLDIYNKKVDSCESRRDEEPFRENQNFAFPRISFSIRLRSATPIADNLSPIFIFIQKYTIHIQKKKKNTWISKLSLIVAVVRLLLLFLNNRYPLMLRRWFASSLLNKNFANLAVLIFEIRKEPMKIQSL